MTVTGKTATVDSPTRIDLAWTNVSTGATGIRIVRGRSGFGPFDNLHVLDAAATSYTDNDLASGNLYFYRAMAFNASGNSTPTNVASARPTTSAPLHRRKAADAPSFRGGQAMPGRGSFS